MYRTAICIDFVYLLKYWSHYHARILLWPPTFHIYMRNLCSTNFPKFPAKIHLKHDLCHFCTDFIRNFCISLQMDRLPFIICMKKISPIEFIEKLYTKYYASLILHASCLMLNSPSFMIDSLSFILQSSSSCIILQFAFVILYLYSECEFVNLQLQMLFSLFLILNYIVCPW